MSMMWGHEGFSKIKNKTKGGASSVVQVGLLKIKKYCVGNFIRKGLESNMGNYIENKILEFLLTLCSYIMY